MFMMFGRVLLILCASACVCTGEYVSSTIVPNTVVLPSTETPVNSADENLIPTNETNEAAINNEPNICTTEVCKNESALMRSYLDDNVDPCDNFYEFACGRFIRVVAPQNKSVRNLVIQNRYKVQRNLESVLEEEQKENESKPFKLAKDFYRVCKNLTMNFEGTRLKRRSASKIQFGILQMIKYLEKYGGWPVVKGNDWASENWDWFETIKKMSNDNLPFGLLFDSNIAVDLKNTTRRILVVSKLCIFQNTA